MFAYIDETGNSGKNLFDPEQPVFMTAAVMTRRNFDLFHTKNFQALAAGFGDTSLHANKLGLGRIEQIAETLLEIVASEKTRFFISSIDKNYLATSKLVDTLFDPFENKAVPWHVYNLRVMRIMLVFKAGYILNEDIMFQFWDGLMQKNEKRAYEYFTESLKKLREQVPGLPDARSRELFIDAIDWALKYPEEIYVHSSGVEARNGHLSNMAVFPELLGGIEQQSQLWQSKVHQIKHDRQSEFEKTLKEWHERHKNASAKPIHLPGKEKYVMRRVEGSKLIVSNSNDSPGIQVADIMMWLFKKLREGHRLPQNCARLMHYVLKYGYMVDLSFEGVSRQLSGTMKELEEVEMTDERIKFAQNTLDEIEQNRKKAMLELEEKKTAKQD